MLGISAGLIAAYSGFAPQLLGAGGFGETVYMLAGFVLLGLAFGQSSGAVNASFSSERRYTGAATVANLAWLIGAGFAPLVALALASRFGLWSVGLYLLSGALCTLAALADGVEIRQVTGGDLTEAHWDAFFAFYMDTGSRKWGRPYLNRRFFSLIGERMAERVLLVLAYRDGRAIAGALNLIGADALYGRYWGATEPQPFLHFELCYHQAIDFAIARKLARVEAGAQGDHKLARGYVPVTTHSAHHIVDPNFRRAVETYLKRERAEVARAGEVLADMTPYRRG